MPLLPNPELVKRKAPSPGGPAGFIQADNVRAPGADTAIGDALTNMGEEAYKYVMVEKARMDDVAVDDAKNQYLQEVLNLETEYGQIKGKAAVDQDIAKDYTAKLDSVSERITSGFKNDDQRRAWDSYYGKSKPRFSAGVIRHKLNESDQYASDTYKSTNIMRVQNAHSNWADAGAVNSSANDIVKNIAKEKLRAGWGEERTEVELKANLGPLWSGVAAQYINAKQYDMAKKILDQHQDAIGVDKYTSYHKSIDASETIDISQEKAANILGTVQGDAAQRKAAREIGGALGDETLKRVKTFQVETRMQKEADKRAQSENDIKWVSEFGVESLNNGTLTIEGIESAGLSPENEALWKTKYYNQGEKKDKEAAAKNTNDKYADWLEKATLEPDKYTPEDVAKDIDPNGGGLTGPQYTNVLSIMSTKKEPKTTAASAAVRGKAQLKSMYNRGDFGKIETGKDKTDTDAWETYSNVLIEYQQKVIEEPTVDHTDWFNNRVEEEGTNSLYKKLDDDWGGIFYDDSDNIITEWLTKQGKATTARNIKAVRERYKSRKK